MSTEGKWFLLYNSAHPNAKSIIGTPSYIPTTSRRPFPPPPKGAHGLGLASAHNKYLNAVKYQQDLTVRTIDLDDPHYKLWCNIDTCGETWAGMPPFFKTVFLHGLTKQYCTDIMGIPKEVVETYFRFIENYGGGASITVNFLTMKLLPINVTLNAKFAKQFIADLIAFKKEGPGGRGGTRPLDAESNKHPTLVLQAPPCLDHVVHTLGGKQGYCYGNSVTDIRDSLTLASATKVFGLAAYHGYVDAMKQLLDRFGVLVVFTPSVINRLSREKSDDDDEKTWNRNDCGQKPALLIAAFACRAESIVCILDALQQAAAVADAGRLSSFGNENEFTALTKSMIKKSTRRVDGGLSLLHPDHPCHQHTTGLTPLMAVVRNVSTFVRRTSGSPSSRNRRHESRRRKGHDAMMLCLRTLLDHGAGPTRCTLSDPGYITTRQYISALGLLADYPVQFDVWGILLGHLSKSHHVDDDVAFRRGTKSEIDHFRRSQVAPNASKKKVLAQPAVNAVGYGCSLQHLSATRYLQQLCYGSMRVLPKKETWGCALQILVCILPTIVDMFHKGTPRNTLPLSLQHMAVTEVFDYNQLAAAAASLDPRGVPKPLFLPPMPPHSLLQLVESETRYSNIHHDEAAFGKTELLHFLFNSPVESVGYIPHQRATTSWTAKEKTHWVHDRLLLRTLVFKDALFL